MSASSSAATSPTPSRARSPRPPRRCRRWNTTCCSSTPIDKPRVVTEIAARDGRTILFARTKHGVDKLVKTLRREGINAVALHGGKAQNARNRAIAAFKDGSAPVLVATDVAARGIHVDDVSLVVHVDPPADPKDYLHRAGRTARAGESGAVVTIVTPHQRPT